MVNAMSYPSYHRRYMSSPLFSPLSSPQPSAAHVLTLPSSDPVITGLMLSQILSLLLLSSTVLVLSRYLFIVLSVFLFIVILHPSSSDSFVTLYSTRLFPVNPCGFCHLIMLHLLDSTHQHFNLLIFHRCYCMCLYKA